MITKLFLFIIVFSNVGKLLLIHLFVRELTDHNKAEKQTLISAVEQRSSVKHKAMFLNTS